MPERFVSKIPEVTPRFWAAKVLAGPVAAAGGGALARVAGLTLGTAIFGFALVAVLVGQLAGRRYVPARYWLAVLLAAGTGRLLGAYLTDDLTVPLPVAAAALAVLLAGTRLAGRRGGHIRSSRAVDTPGREAWYWLTALGTFALGSVLADLPRLSYAVSASVAAALVALVAAARFRLGLDPAAAFWLAFLLTQPLGLLLGELLARPRPDGGAGLGPAVTGLTGLAVLVAVVARRDPRPTHLVGPGPGPGRDR